MVWFSLHVRECLIPIYYFFIFPRLFRPLALANVRKALPLLAKIRHSLWISWISLLPRGHDAMLPRGHGAMLPRSHAAMLPHCQDATLPRCHPLPYLCFFAYAILQSFQRHRQKFGNEIPPWGQGREDLPPPCFLHIEWFLESAEQIHIIILVK